MKIGIYGGTFDPPHLGHRIAAEAAMKALGLEKLLVIPANQPPHKGQKAGSPSPEARLEMTRLAFADLDGAEVSDIELRRGGRSYTVETLESLKEQYPGDTLVLLMGTDMFLYLEKWYRFEDILRLANIGTFTRNPGEDGELSAMDERLHRLYGARTELVKSEPYPVSSTQVRELLPQRQGSGYLSSAVYRYILKNRLYGAKPELACLRSWTEPMQDEKRLGHVHGCEEMARSLAKRWGADEDEAAEAAILHDLTKKYDLAHQLKLCREYGIMTDAVECESSLLLHSKTGAAMAEREFGTAPEISSAIRFHTTGRPGMTLLEKIVCLADSIELSRTYADLTHIRALAFEDLDGALKLSFEMTLASLHRRGLTVHPMTLEALADLEQKHP